ncbi:MAG: P-loop NTPase, partial [Chloroflexi bacterium]|nr:P-loop NTPase [Chloroflexota bacterium]
IADADMPYVNGLELARLLRTNHRTAHVPIIMLSPHKEVDSILAGHIENADEFLPKPVELSILLEKIEQLLRGSRSINRLKFRRQPGKVVVFFRGKGGAGASTLAVNSAVALALSKSHRVSLLDLNLEFGSTSMMLDVRPEKTLADLNGVSVAELEDADFARLTAKHPSGVRLVVASDLPEKAELVSIAAVNQTLDVLRHQSDFVFVDLAPSFSELNLGVLDAADTICLVTTPHFVPLKATIDCLHVFDKLKFPTDRLLLFLNRTTPAGLENEQVAKIIHQVPDLVIPYTSQFDDAADSGQPVVIGNPQGAAAVAIRDLAAKIANLVPAKV